MKIYDKEIYKRQESMRSIIIMIVVFLLGFFAGYIVNMGTNSEEGNKVNMVQETANNIIE